jgi:hypothetical protein
LNKGYFEKEKKIMDRKKEGGTIINKSGRTLIVAMDSPTEDDRWAYMPLSPNRKTAVNIDADAFRVRDEGVKISYSNPGTARLGWWKIRNGMLATVYAGKDNEGSNCVNFEVELKYPSALLGAANPVNIIFDQRIRYAVGSAVLSPLPKENKDYDWDGANALIAEASEPIS